MPEPLAVGEAGVGHGGFSEVQVLQPSEMSDVDQFPIGGMVRRPDPV